MSQVWGEFNLKIDEIAKRITQHLRRFERDKKINKADAMDLKPYYFAQAGRAGPRVAVTYITYQGPTNLTKADAEKYLAWLDAGNVGKHHEALGE